ncbi:MAG: hypothetical protein ABIQ95_02090, partial [Bdellovibrionia bacterium]
SLKGVESSIYDPVFISSQFAAIVGGFTRFFYVLPFLKGKTLMTNVFLRLELGGGSTSMGSPAGLLLQGGAHFGVETYINKWLGISLSYGRTIEWGKETLASGSTSAFTSPFKGSTMWNQGSMVLASVKTTFF